MLQALHSLKRVSYKKFVDILQQLFTTSRYQDAFAWFATACSRQIGHYSLRGTQTPNFLIIFFFHHHFSVITVRSSLALSDGFDDTKTWDENNALDVSDVNDDVIYALNTSTPDEKGERRDAHVQNTTLVPVSSTPPTSALVKKLFSQLKTKKEVYYTAKNAQALNYK